MDIYIVGIKVGLQPKQGGTAVDVKEECNWFGADVELCVLC